MSGELYNWFTVGDRFSHAELPGDFLERCVAFGFLHRLVNSVLRGVEALAVDKGVPGWNCDRADYPQ